VQIVCLDLEGVLVPEIWIEFATRTGIPELRRTTRDEPDYDKLMKYRLAILTEHGLGLPDIQKVIAAMGPLDGARAFRRWPARGLSVDHPVRHFLRVCAPADAPAWLADAVLPQPRSRRRRNAGALPPAHARPEARGGSPPQGTRFTVVAAGDSYNDTAMLARGARRHPFPPARERDPGIPAVPGDAVLCRTARRDRQGLFACATAEKG
jgi:phosphoserine/homoserine phosphotransferase